jgi:hypothetical protein
VSFCVLVLGIATKNSTEILPQVRQNIDFWAKSQNGSKEKIVK